MTGTTCWVANGAPPVLVTRAALALISFIREPHSSTDRVHSSHIRLNRTAVESAVPLRACCIFVRSHSSMMSRARLSTLRRYSWPIEA